MLVTDGPYAETKEFLGGLTVVDVPDDETATMWAGRLAEGCGWPQEVRRFGTMSRRSDPLRPGARAAGPRRHPA